MCLLIERRTVWDFVLFHMPSSGIIENVSAFAWKQWNNITFKHVLMNTYSFQLNPKTKTKQAQGYHNSYRWRYLIYQHFHEYFTNADQRKQLIEHKHKMWAVK